jgi:hypothetical protein
MKTFLTQGLVVQNKAGLLPEQALDSGAVAIGKDIQSARERIVSELMLNDQTQAAVAFSEINGLSV